MQRNTIIDTTQSFRVIDPDAYRPESSVEGEGKDSQQRGVYPMLPYEGKNFLPTDEGYKSYFGTDPKLDGNALATDVHSMWVLESLTYKNILIALTREGMFYKIADGSDWVKVVPDTNAAKRKVTANLVEEDATEDLSSMVAADPVGTMREWTTATIKNVVYAYKQGDPAVYRIEHDTVNAEGFKVSTVIPSHLNMEGQMGIFHASGVLGFWDSDQSFGLSSLKDPLDFVPSTTTFADSMKFKAIVGAITTVKPFGDGFVIYATKSALRVREDNTSAFRWTAENLLTDAGVAYPRQVVVSQPDTIHFAWTSMGVMQIIVDEEPKPIIPDVYDYLKTMQSPIYLSLIQGRYLCVEVMESDFLTGNVQFSEQTVDPIVYTYGQVDFPQVNVEDVVIPGSTVCFDVGGGSSNSGTHPFIVASEFRGYRMPYMQVTGYSNRLWEGAACAWQGSAPDKEDIWWLTMEQSIPSQVSGATLDAFHTTQLEAYKQLVIDNWTTEPQSVSTGSHSLITETDEGFYTGDGDVYSAFASEGSLLDWQGQGKRKLIKQEVLGDFDSLVYNGYTGHPVQHVEAVPDSGVGDLVFQSGFRVYEQTLSKVAYLEDGSPHVFDVVFTGERALGLKATGERDDGQGGTETITRSSGPMIDVTHTIRFEGSVGTVYTPQDAIDAATPEYEAWVQTRLNTVANQELGSLIAEVEALGYSVTSTQYRWTIPGSWYDTPIANLVWVPPSIEANVVDSWKRKKYEYYRKWDRSSVKEQEITSPATKDKPVYVHQYWYSRGELPTNGSYNHDEVPPYSPMEPGMTREESGVDEAAAFANRYYTYPVGYGEPQQVCGITEDLVADGINLDVPSIPGWSLQGPTNSFLMQQGSVAPIYPTREGAFVYDLQLNKWGKYVGQYKQLINFQALNGNQQNSIPYQHFTVYGGIVDAAGEVRLFDNKPSDSFLKYGKYRHFPSPMTNIQEVILNFDGTATGQVTVQASLSGNRPEYGHTRTKLYTDKLQVTLPCDIVGAWHTVTITGTYDLTGMQIKSHTAGRR